MQMIVDIDEDYVKIINKNGASNYAEEVIKNGTPLPKEHGNLIDIKDLYEHLNKERDDDFVLKADAIVSKIKPIIEADKAESEEIKCIE